MTEGQTAEAGSERRKSWFSAILLIASCLVIMAPIWRHPEKIVAQQEGPDKRAARPVYIFSPEFRLEQEPDKDGCLSMDIVIEQSFNFLVSDAWNRFGEFPIWTPQLGGGAPFAAHPTNRSYSLQWLPLVWFGEVVGAKLVVTLIFIAAVLGFHRYLRAVMGIAAEPSLIASLVFAFAPWFITRYLDGNSSELGYLFLGLFLATIHAAAVDLRRLWMPVVVINCLCADLRLGAVLYPVLAVWFALAEPGFIKLGRIRVLTVIAVATGLGYLTAAPKLLTLTSLIHRGVNPGEFLQVDVHGVVDFFDSIFSRAMVGAGLGKAAAIPAVLIALVQFRRTLPYSLVAAAVVLLLLGDQSPIPVNLLAQKLPLIQKFYAVPKHYNAILTFTLTCLLAIAIQSICRALDRLPYRPLRYAALVVLTALLCLNPARTSLARMYAVEYVDVVDFGREPELFTITTDKIFYAGTRNEHCDTTAFNYSTMLRRNIGIRHPSANQMEIKPYVTAKYVIGDRKADLNPDYWGEIRLRDAAPGTEPLRIQSRTYNTISFAVPASDAPRSVQINQNYAHGWHASQGEVAAVDSLLTLHLPAGVATDVQLRFAPWQHTLGVWISAAVILGLVLQSRPWQIRRSTSTPSGLRQ